LKNQKFWWNIFNKGRIMADPTEDRLKNIPRRHWAEHEFSFYLYDLIAALTQEAEPAGAGRLRVKLEKDLCITPFYHEMRAAPAWAGAYVGW
jgi:hypothetical protein